MGVSESAAGGEAELEVERVDESGSGMAPLTHLGGGTAAVPHALPGERVLVHLRDAGTLRGRKRGETRLSASLMRVLAASPHRREAACPLFGKCGGCQWLHADEAFQRKVKADALRSVFQTALAGSGADGQLLSESEKIDVTVEEVSPTLGYRCRTSLHVREGSLGFSMARSHEVLPVQTCALLAPQLNLALKRLADALSESRPERLRLPQGCTDLALSMPSGRAAFDAGGDAATKPVSAAFFLEKRPGKEAVRRAAELVREAELSGAVLVWGEGGTPGSESIGRPLFTSPAPLVPGAVIFGRPDFFAQAHILAGDVLAEAVTALVPEKGRILELYGGSGTLTLALAARSKSVTSIEISAGALSFARRSAAEAGLDNIRCIAGDAIETAHNLARGGERFDAVVLDPPRAGAKGIAQTALEAGARRVIYVSCNPKTLALDARQLSLAGFRPVFLKGFDLFPQTQHLEAVAAFERED